eukprot:gene17114-30715_t
MADQSAVGHVAGGSASHADFFEDMHAWKDAARTSDDGSSSPSFSEKNTPTPIRQQLMSTQLKVRCSPIVDAIGPPPLIHACLQGRRADAVALLALGADPAFEGDVPMRDAPLRKYKLFPLAAAAREGHDEIVALLLASNGVDANQSSTDLGLTALVLACRFAQVAAIKLLLA